MHLFGTVAASYMDIMEVVGQGWMLHRREGTPEHAKQAMPGSAQQVACAGWPSRGGHQPVVLLHATVLARL